MHRTILLLTIILSLLLPVSALADGIIVPDPIPCPAGDCKPIPMNQLVVRYHRVQVTIQDQIAVTHVDQVFYNPNDWVIEGTYFFPIPNQAAVTDFTLWIDGEPVQGEMLEAEQARQRYYEIVNNLRDPALLEYADQGAVQAHIYPIPPQGERRIELEYSQVLPAENGLVRYLYPLNTEKFSAQPIENVAVNVDLSDSQPIRAVYSPSHTIDVERQDDHHIQARYEASNVLPDTDFALYYSLGTEQAFHLISYRDPRDTDPDGSFLLLLAPSLQTSEQPQAKDLVLVLDHSGSMDGEKFRQAQAALRYILERLNPEDRFGLISFSTGVEYYSPDLRPASDASQAIAWVDRLSAQGSTDIQRALLEAANMTGGERPTYLIFLTDGLPTEGETDSQKILDNFSAAAPVDLRLFVFGVGYDVDTYLLDSLAQGHQGLSSYVLPDERLDETLSTFYEKVSTPVLTNLELDFGDLSVYDLYPQPLPDLFKGSQIILAGRYRQGGEGTITLTGLMNGEEVRFTYADQKMIDDYRQADIAHNDPQSAIPRLWATRKIGYLLNEIRLKGAQQELVDQIVKLSIRYGIVTPYTSYLVTEPLALGAQEQERIARDQLQTFEVMATQPVSGEAAVQKAADQGSLSRAEAPAAPASMDTGNRVRILGGRVFVQNNGTWIDTAFDPLQMHTIKVAFLSPDYYNLIQAYPELAAAFALGSTVIALADGEAYEVVSADESVPPLDIPDQPEIPAESRTISEVPVRPEEPGNSNEPEAPPQEARQSPTCLAGLLPVAALVGMALLHRRRHR